MDESFKFYGVHISPDIQDKNKIGTGKVFSNREDAVMFCKENKKGRFKPFDSEHEAMEFCKNGSSGGSGNPHCLSESLPFKAPKSDDIFQLRKLLEGNDCKAVKELLWKNPRYLISEGDVATILQEGSRYNALHVCTRHGRAEIAELILDTVSDSKYLEKLYGSQHNKSSSVLIESLLNTPEKSLNETPLHFATKFGAVDIVKLFLTYPQCKKNRLNKHGQKPADITCSRYSHDDPAVVRSVTEEINAMLEGGYLVPVWRSPTNDLQPVVGDPFSPPLMPTSPTKNDPLSPTMEIVALAGPMKFDDAVEFRKKWRMSMKNETPGRSPASPVRYTTPHPKRAILIRPGSVDNVDKSIEKTGRDLAKKLNVKWKEQWSFLKLFIDLSTEKGLEALEQYLRSRFTSMNSDESSSRFNVIESRMTSENSKNVNNNLIKSNLFLSSYNYICDKLKLLVITRKSPELTELSSIDSRQSWTDNFVECFCMNFSVRIVEKIKEHFSENRPTDDCLIALLDETEKLLEQISQWQLAEHSETFPFDKVYCKAGELISERLKIATENQAQYALAVFEPMLKKSTSTVIQEKLPVACQLYSSSNLNVILNTFQRICEQLIDRFTLPDCKQHSISQSRNVSCCSAYETPKSSLEYYAKSNDSNDELKMECSNLQQIVRNNEDDSPKIEMSVKFRSSSRRKIDFSTDDDSHESSPQSMDDDIMRYTNQSVPQPNSEEEAVSIDGNKIFKNNNDVSEADKIKIDGDVSDDDAFLTPNGSEYDDNDDGKIDDFKSAMPDSDNEEMDDVEEGPDMFLVGDHGSNLDIIIHDILIKININTEKYPLVYRWRHWMSLYIDKLHRSSS